MPLLYDGGRVCSAGEFHNHAEGLTTMEYGRITQMPEQLLRSFVDVVCGPPQVDAAAYE